MATQENSVQRACLNYLRLKGILCWRANSSPIPLPKGGFRSFAGLRGVADILAVVPMTVDVVGRGPMIFGILLACECKSPTGKLSKHQEAFRDAVVNAGGIYVVARSVNDLIEALAKEGVRL